MILNIKAPETPHKIICFLFFGMKLAEMTPMIIALSAVKIIVMNIICDSISNSSNKAGL